LFIKDDDPTAPPGADRAAFGAQTPTYHVVVDDPCDAVLPRHCLACGCGHDVLIRRVTTRHAAPGVHFFTWAGRPLRLPLCESCDSRLRRRLELPLLVWFFALPVAVGFLGWAFARGMLPVPGIVLTSLIAIPVCLVRVWLNRQPPPFEVTDYKAQIGFAWTDRGRAAEFAELNGTDLVPWPLRANGMEPGLNVTERE
jgi:hypothetical protein